MRTQSNSVSFCIDGIDQIWSFFSLFPANKRDDPTKESDQTYHVNEKDIVSNRREMVNT